MPIKPKHTLAGSRPSASRQFTDREDFIATFQKALAEHKFDIHQILVYYGVGGIGKTSLRKELTRLLASEPGVITATLDFDVPGYRDQDTALFVLRKLLRDRHKVQFPSFDIAYAVHWQKTRPQTPMTRNNFPLLESGTVLSDAIDVLGNLTLVGLIPKLTGIALKSSQTVRDWWTKRGSTELHDLPSLEPPQIAERLPMFWASDLKDFLAAKGGKAVLFLDTYEALTETERSEGKLYQRDEWVRELVAQLPGVLWVVCGREMLRWADFDSDWKDSLSQHLVGGLADEDARQFLKTCGIEDRTIADTIVKGSTGLPYYLDLAVDTYLEAKRRGVQPKPGDFAHTPAEVFARFLRHLTQPEIETLKVLAVPRFWDTSLIEHLVTRFQTGYPLTAFTDLCRFSFINESTLAGTYTMHQLMRQSLQEHASPELVKRVHRLLFEHYDGRLKDIDIKNITDRQKTALAEAFYHGRAALTVQEFFHWFLKPAEQFFHAAQGQLLVPLFELVGHDLEVELGPEHPDVAESLNNLALLLGDQSKPAEVELLLRRALAIREKVLGSEHPAVAESLINIAIMLLTQGKPAEAEPLLRRALAIREKVLGSEHPDVAGSINDLASALLQQGKIAEAELLVRRALAIREKVCGAEHSDVANSLNTLGMLLGQQDKYVEAEPMLRRSLAICEMTLGPEHPSTTTVMHNLARQLLAQDKSTEAEPMLRRVLAICETRLGPDHPYVARSMDSLAELYEKTGRSEEANSLAERAKAIRTKVQQK